MKICLIEPSKFVSATNFVSMIRMPPLGLAYIAAVLRRAGHEICVIDCPGMAPSSYFKFKDFNVRGLTSQEVCEKIPDDVDIIALGCMFTSHWLLVRDLVSEIREKFPSKLIIMGGEHVTGFPEYSMVQAPLDAVVMGEGEETILELLDCVSDGVPFDGIAGLAFRTASGKIQVNPRRARLKNIDEIPWPAWDLFDIHKYNEVNQPHGASQGRFIPMLATRGCPFQCTFCTSPAMWTTEWIPRDHQNVVDEMVFYNKKYGITDFQFEDLTAIVRKDWIEKFCDEIISRDFKITFQLPSGTRSEAINYEVARKLKAAGCHEFAFAPESGDPRVLKAIKKNVNLPNMFKAARDARRAKINVGCFFILGFPEDDYRSVLKTYAAIVKCAWIGFTNINVNAYSPQPNTESFRALKEKGIIGDIDDEYLKSLFTFQDYGAKKTSYNPQFSDWKLSFFVSFGMVLFYTCYFTFRPYRFYELVRDLFSKSSANKTTKGAKAFLNEMCVRVKNKIA